LRRVDNAAANFGFVKRFHVLLDRASCRFQD
jgi:hypothetical protein